MLTGSTSFTAGKDVCAAVPAAARSMTAVAMPIRSRNPRASRRLPTNSGSETGADPCEVAPRATKRNPDAEVIQLPTSPPAPRRRSAIAPRT
ncbi:MAG: hypothetical protein AMXMBFR47_12940 [Planctomycetota bacterium]